MYVDRPKIIIVFKIYHRKRKRKHESNKNKPTKYKKHHNNVEKKNRVDIITTEKERKIHTYLMAFLDDEDVDAP